jgi:DNA-binding GntR family transcriptional regulator
MSTPERKRFVDQLVTYTLEVEGRLERSRQEHGRILAALLDGDAAAAACAASAHVRNARAAAEVVPVAVDLR